jgi:predicted DNA-binding transcriptional regulator YafY
MSEAKDTLLRLFALLRQVPVEPQRIATTTLLEKLKDRGFSVTLRSVQRDLNRLSVPFSLQCDDSETPYRWSFTRDAPLELSDMDAPTALALYLSESHLSATLPQSVMAQLGPQFRRARNYLDGLGRNGLAHWARRVRSLPNGKALLPAQLASQVWAKVSAALLEGKQLQVEYLSRSKAGVKSFCIHPAGLVCRHSISYLIGTVNNYTDLRQFALHRIQKAELLDAPADELKDFDLDRYIADGAFTLRQAVQRVDPIADVHPQVAWLLSETPLSVQQDLESIPGTDWQRLRAMVPLDQETLWWIFGLNNHIRVHAPCVWVEEIRLRVEGLQRLYSNECEGVTAVGTY